MGSTTPPACLLVHRGNFLIRAVGLPLGAEYCVPRMLNVVQKGSFFRFATSYTRAGQDDLFERWGQELILFPDCLSTLIYRLEYFLELLPLLQFPLLRLQLLLLQLLLILQSPLLQLPLILQFPLFQLSLHL